MRKNFEAITLVEVLLYLALFGIFFVTMINYFFFLEDTNQLSSESLKIDRNVILISQHLEESFKNSTDIVVSATPPDIYTIWDDEGSIDTLVLNINSNVAYTISSSRLKFGDTEISRRDLIVRKFDLEEIKNSSDTVVGARITIELVSKQDGAISRQFTNSYFLNK